jgi:RNA 2',3'-cyclic 3'-phosphodiesterase
MTMPRLFVAIDIPETLCTLLHAMGRGIPGARPVGADQIHLTLRFIGEVDGGVARDIKDALSEVQAPPFSLAIRGVGHFPPRRAPRVLWAGLDPCEELILLRNRIERRLVDCGLEPEPRKFSPHITIARLKDSPLRRIGEFLAGNALFCSESFAVDEFILYSSRLIKSGAVHTIEQRYPLQK